jgi:hypothetical protein
MQRREQQGGDEGENEFHGFPIQLGLHVFDSIRVR